MAGHVVDHAGIVRVPADRSTLCAARDSEQDLVRVFLRRFAVDVSLILCIEYAALQTVADRIVENADSACSAFRGGDLPDIGLACPFGFGKFARAARPAFTVNEAFRVDGVQCLFDRLHGSYVMQCHQVEAETVDVVFRCPVDHGIDHVFTVHRTLGSGLVAAAGAAAVITGQSVAVIVIRNDFVQVGIGVVSVVVDHVHDHTQAGVMQRLHHLLEFLHAHFSVFRIRRIAAFRDIVVLRIIAPVEILAGRFINGSIVINRLQMDMRDAQFLQVVDADGYAGVILQPRFGESKVFTRIGAFFHRIREIAYVDFPDHGILIVFDAVVVFVLVPAFRIGGVKVDDHAALSVHAGRFRVRVDGFLFTGRSRYGISVVGACAAFLRALPDALLSLGHFNVRKCAAPVSFFKQVQDDFGGCRRPELEGRALPVFAQDCAQIIAVIGVILNEIR